MNVNTENAIRSIESKIDSKFWNNGFVWGAIVGVTIATIVIKVIL